MSTPALRFGLCFLLALSGCVSPRQRLAQQRLAIATTVCPPQTTAKWAGLTGASAYRCWPNIDLLNKQEAEERAVQAERDSHIYRYSDGTCHMPGLVEAVAKPFAPDKLPWAEYQKCEDGDLKDYPFQPIQTPVDRAPWHPAPLIPYP